MAGHDLDATDRKWYHVVWRTARRRPLFKIPAARRFCERELRRRLLARNWDVGAVFVGPAQLHVLVRPAGAITRGAVVRECQRYAEHALRATGVRLDRREPLWQEPAWCGAIPPGPALTACRRWLHARSGALTEPAGL